MHILQLLRGSHLNSYVVVGTKLGNGSPRGLSSPDMRDARGSRLYVYTWSMCKRGVTGRLRGVYRR